MNRRRLLQSLLGSAGCMALPAWAVPTDSAPAGTLLSACDDVKGNHYIASMRPDGTPGFRIPVPLRAHASCVTADRSRAIFFARRPGHLLYVVDLQQGSLIQTLAAAPGRHFYGHGEISPDGQWLFATEQRYDSGEGIIGVYRLTDPVVRETELLSHAMDPHELRWLSDGETLVIANGGIRTHPSQHREVLNPDTMTPALTYVRARDGALLDSVVPPHHQMSLHHLAVAANDDVVVGVQYQGAITDEVSLAGRHRLAGEWHWWMADELTQLRMRQYTASVAVDRAGTTALISCPRGNGIAVWDIPTGELVNMLDIADAAGLDRAAGDGTWVGTNGNGERVQIRRDGAIATLKRLQQLPLRWDNHLTVV